MEMLSSSRNVAFILARKGSKRLPNKNLLDFCGKPLIQWTIEAALGSKRLSAVYLSTDCEEIAALGRKLGIQVPFLRPEHLATDTATSVDVITHLRDWCVQSRASFDSIVLLQPTSPLRTSRHIDDAIDQYYKTRLSENETLVSGYSLGPRSGWLYRKDSDGSLNRLFNSSEDSGELFMPNGAIYIGPFKSFKGFSGSADSRAQGFVMSEAESVDIDTPSDFRLAETFKKHLG